MQISGGSRFPIGGGGAEPLGGADFQHGHFLAKMHAKMKELDPIWGATCWWCPPWVCQCKGLMDQMCSKCEKYCFSHDLQKISKLRNFGKFPNFRKFPKKFFCPNLFFQRIFFLKTMFFSENYFVKEFFIAFKTIALY